MCSSQGQPSRFFAWFPVVMVAAKWASEGFKAEVSLEEFVEEVSIRDSSLAFVGFKD